MSILIWQCTHHYITHNILYRTLTCKKCIVENRYIIWYLCIYSFYRLFATMAYSCPTYHQDSDLDKHSINPKYPLKYIIRVCAMLTSINITFFRYKISTFSKIHVIIKTLKCRKKFLIFLNLLNL